MAEEIRVSVEFIEKELPLAPPLYVSVFFMTQAMGRQATAAEVAQKLDILESDVLKAWKYWKGRGCGLWKEEKKARALPSARPSYSAAEVAVSLKNEGVKELFSYAEQKLGKCLSHHDMVLLLGLHDWLGLPVDVIELLLNYCVSLDKRGMHYIEKVGISWAEEGIDTVEKAAEFIEMRRRGYREIMREFGQGNRLPSQAEEAYMKKWIREYKLPMEIIKTACQRTVLRTGGVSFPYADSILRHWQKAGVRTIEDVAALDAAHTAKKEKAPETKKAAAQPKKNRFINYTQREWDESEWEEMERRERDQW
ncbi:DnaD domain protein [Anaerotignum lactatifermentans]|uniref:DnaD domain protein n=1 Tax=Anaerotignum lactatifermentans TaxID=160404 RepID=A0ABS2GBQ2_9FIRM|nr:DnaD domain protein [Anaerotignum lactatifermentans]MBM6829543.1 DnaD domain protein [Anaerotignum lactatifermentans]MBM6878037.1 DnaD domain protein [Anaerotignum lactatifermentans]MBM6951133.1 DnaD domain protein [Anaerotignum lactatifermentans]